MKEIEDVLDKLSPEGIEDFIVLKHLLTPYLPSGEEFSLRDMVSPVPAIFRHKKKKDTNPSFGFYVNDSKRIRWTDQGIIGQKDQGVLDLIILLVKDVHTIGESYKLYKEIAKGAKVDLKSLVQAANSAKKEIPEIEYSKDYKPWELAYWNNYQVTASMMDFMEIYGLRKASWDNGYSIFSSEKTPRFLYLFEPPTDDSTGKFKLYSPLEPKGPKKFKSYNNDNVEGFPVMMKYLKRRKTEDLFITSSIKDMAVSMQATGWLWLSTAGENNIKGWIKRMPDIRKLDLNLHWIYDGDDVGWTASQKMAKEFGGKAYDLRGKLGTHLKYGEEVDIKDQSDFVSLVGEKADGTPLGNTLQDLHHILKDLVK